MLQIWTSMNPGHGNCRLCDHQKRIITLENMDDCYQAGIKKQLNTRWRYFCKPNSAGNYTIPHKTSVGYTIFRQTSVGYYAIPFKTSAGYSGMQNEDGMDMVVALNIHWISIWWWAFDPKISINKLWKGEGAYPIKEFHMSLLRAITSPHITGCLLCNPL